MGDAVVSDVRFLFLGTGTSAGVPIIGCDCGVCTSADPRDRRTRCSAAIQFRDPTGHERLILFDTAPDLREQALRHKLKRCDAILYTHNHVDHTFGLDDVRRFNALMQGPIDVFAERHTMEHLQRVYRHIFERERNVNDSFVATLIPHLLDPDRPLELLGLRFTPLRFLHGRMPVLGYRVDALDRNGQIANGSQPGAGARAVQIPGAGAGAGAGILPLAYCTDVSAIPPETWPLLDGLGTLVLDMLRYRRHPTHLTVDEAIDIAARLNPSRTFFTHMTHDIEHATLDAELPERMQLAYDGLVLGEALASRDERERAK